MRLVDNLRKAEQKGAMTIRRGVDRAREEWADVERRLRQRMRIYPQKAKAMAMAGGPSGPAAGLDGTRTANQPAEAGEPKPIVSVHGHDIEN